MNKALGTFLIAAVLMVGGCGAHGPQALRTDAPPRELKPPAAVEDDIAVYFSPGGGGMAALINEINHAQKSIDIMAYVITTHEIADPLAAAMKRGVKVRVIMDYKDNGGVFSDKAIFAYSPVPIWRDDKHKEFHHKVMMIDGKVLITGSFNFTTQAEDTNGENLLVIRNHPKLYRAYEEYFAAHLKHSKPPEGVNVAASDHK
jgi:phosphatidylserine/phosphatidylglycerophosphate/cardiolipin synthase-like enzyme